ncbi:MAG: sigma-70 family RNA polymerase sigma factor [Acidimicrobiales bacterium]
MPKLATRPRAGERDDSELTRSVMAGSCDAFEDLYRRHVDAAWRVAQAVLGNPDDAADAVAEAFARILAASRAGRLPPDVAFRPYLLRTVRNTAIDLVRLSARHQSGDDLDILRSPDEPHTRAMAREDSSLVGIAFRALPERWRWVLWLSEVEDMAPRAAAAVLETSANNASQLASRARAALMAAYVQAHVRTNSLPACEHTVRQLGSYVVSRGRRGRTIKVEKHLKGCESCRERLSELDELGLSLQRGVLGLPLPIGLVTRKLWQLQGTHGGGTSITHTPRPWNHEFVSTAWRWCRSGGSRTAEVGNLAGQGQRWLVNFVPDPSALERVAATMAAGLFVLSLSPSGAPSLSEKGGSVRPSTAGEPASRPGVPSAAREVFEPTTEQRPGSESVVGRDLDGSGFGSDGFDRPDALSTVARASPEQPAPAPNGVGLPALNLSDTGPPGTSPVGLVANLGAVALPSPTSAGVALPSPTSAAR